MTDKNRTRKKKNAPEGSSRAKGDLVEQIVESMHKTPGVKIERNVFLPVQDGTTRTREIDVLISSEVAGYPVRIAIECKNEKGPIGIEEIDEFIGKLDDVGIPVQQGIFVSASTYTSGARFRAQKAGIKSLLLKDVTPNLPFFVQEAFQSLIYLILTITSVQIRNDIPSATFPGELLFFRNADGAICGAVADLVWQDWKSGKISDKLGNHSIDLELPHGWIQVIDGRVAKIYSIKADVKITGHVIKIVGKVQHHTLVDAVNSKQEREQIKASFERPSGPLPIKMFETEEELEHFIHPAQGINITLGRFRIPRIIWDAVYWPPSKNSAEKVLSLLRDFANGKIPDPRPFKFNEIEGDDLHQAWEPIWEEHPSIKPPTLGKTGG